MFPNEVAFVIPDHAGQSYVVIVPKELVEEVNGRTTLRVRLVDRDKGIALVRVPGGSNVTHCNRRSALSGRTSARSHSVGRAVAPALASPQWGGPIPDEEPVINAGRFTLSTEQVHTLHTRHPIAPDQSWIPEVVRAQGWEVANVRYLEGERLRYAEAMRDLLADLGIAGPSDPGEALDLVSLAFEVFAPEEGFGGSLTRGPDNELRILNPRCPTHELMEAQGWLGVTACASWHRRRGWLDALGVDASDSVLAEKRWSSPVCAAMLRINGVAAQTGGDAMVIAWRPALRRLPRTGASRDLATDRLTSGCPQRPGLRLRA